MAPLVCQQHGKTVFQAELEAAAAVPLRRGTVTVEKEQQRRAGTSGVVFAHQPQAVVGGDGYPFKGTGQQIVDIPQDQLPVGRIFLSLRDGADRGDALRVRLKRGAVSVPGAANCQRRRTRCQSGHFFDGAHFSSSRVRAKLSIKVSRKYPTSGRA